MTNEMWAIGILAALLAATWATMAIVWWLLKCYFRNFDSMRLAVADLLRHVTPKTGPVAWISVNPGRVDSLCLCAECEKDSAHAMRELADLIDPNGAEHQR